MSTPARKPIDVEIDRYWHLMVFATTEAAKKGHSNTIADLKKSREAIPAKNPVSKGPK